MDGRTMSGLEFLMTWIEYLDGWMDGFLVLVSLMDG